MDEQDLLRRVCDVAAAYLELGNETFDAAGATFVRNRATPRRFDANHAGRITCTTSEEVDRLFARAADAYAHLPYRRFDVDPLTPPAVEARLRLEGFRENAGIQFVLEGPLHADPPPCDVRPAESDDDWAAYEALDAIDWRETHERRGEAFDLTLVSEFVAYKRAKAPAVRYWLAWVEGAPRGYFSSWEGRGGVGVVEDLFVHPDFRRRGIGTALIARAIVDARSRGAVPVTLSADPDDTPKRMYAAMGFRPVAIMRHYFKRIEGFR